MSLARPALLLPLAMCLSAAFAAEPKFANRLAKESSPYLLHHAHNPVDWYPWGEEAFAKAKREGKLVFLSSGYSSCHWCHVMERESFMDEAVAALLNQHFVCIKLDREERPEVDHLYLTALNAMGHNGGWPLSMFLTADGKPIAGGTYWPREDREIQSQTVAGFKTILQSVIDVHKQAPDNIRKTAELRAAQTRQLLGSGLNPAVSVEPSRALIDAAVEQLEATFDSEFGGFGARGPKFPRPPLLQLLQSEAARKKSPALDRVVHTTLEKMARGGIYDHLGGGFHRYSVDRTWTVPHFEKMLYDNGQLLEVYARAYQETQRPLYKAVLQDTLAFVDREMTSPDGAFYTSLDADSSGEEGRFYVWTDDELAAVVKDAADLQWIRSTYGADDLPNFEEQYHILVLAKPVTENDERRWQRIKQRLLEARGKRPRPSLDTKVLTSWNGQMIAGMAFAGHVLGDAQAVQRAGRAAEFLLKTVRDRNGRLFHSYAAAPGESAKPRVDGYLDDYTHLVHGLLTLHEVTGEGRWLAEAKSVTDTMVSLFHDNAGGFYFTAAEHELLFARMKDQYDGVQPCGNSQAAANLVRLWRKTGDENYRKLAEETFRTFAASMDNDPRGLCAMAAALGEFLDEVSR